MGFRDDNEALRARLRTLEEENRRLEEALERATEPEPEPAAPPELESPPAEADDLAALVAAREAAERRAAVRERTAAEKERDRAAARLAKRPRRVHVESLAGVTRVRVDALLLRDKLQEQLGWGFGFIFINPGAFIVLAGSAWVLNATDLDAGVGIALVVLLWALALALMNLAWAAVMRDSWRLEMTTGEHFALYSGRSKQPTLLGRLSELDARVPEPDDARLHQVTLRDGRGRVEIENLTGADLRALRGALARARVGGFFSEPRARVDAPESGDSALFAEPLEAEDGLIDLRRLAEED